jgi:hypothetical protein
MKTDTNCVPRSRHVPADKTSITRAFAALALSLAFAAPAAGQDLSGLDLGVNKDFVFVSLGSGGSAKINSGPIAGSVLMGQGSTLTTSGGNNGGLTDGGIVFYDGTASVDSSGLNTPPMESLVSQALTLSALNSAVSVSNYASGLTATQTFGQISSATTITGNGGLNVINMTGLKGAELTLNGGADDFFVFNVSGVVDTNKQMFLTGGLEANRVLWNLTASSGQAFKTAGGNSSVGTFLAVNGADFQFSNLVLDGALINVGGHIEFVSGSRLTEGNTFTIPEPSAALLGGIGFMILLRRRRH